jgi:tetratricopeptide (TPR) repeat protein
MELMTDQILQDAIEAHKSGQIQKANRLYIKILTAQPNHPVANYNLGVLAAGVGEIETALSYLKIALEANPNITQFWSSYVDALLQLDRFVDAKNVLMLAETKGVKGEIFEKLAKRIAKADSSNAGVTTVPTNASTGKDPPEDQLKSLINLYNHGLFEQAFEKSKRLAATFPKSPVLFNLQGALLRNLGHLELSIEAYKKALSIKPNYFDAYNNMGSTLKNQGQFDAAIEAYKKALFIQPDNAPAYNNMGNALKDQGKLDDAIFAYKKALSLNPEYAEAYNNLGNALTDQGELEEGVKVYKKALTVKPDFAEAYSNMSTALKYQGKLHEAIYSCKKALSLNPDYAEAHYKLSFLLLSDGKLKEALDEYEWRTKITKSITEERQFSKPLWDGTETLSGKKILLWSEQGVGDTINWVSRLPHISSQAEHCILECPEKLISLMARSFPNIEVKILEVTNDAKRNDFDYHLPLGSLYRHFLPEILVDTKPGAFLVPDPVRVKFWIKRLKSLGSGPFVGVSWKSANMSPERLPNYANISEWSPIFSIPDVVFINLQYVDFDSDLIEIQNRFGVSVHNFDDLDHYNDLDDVAALCAALDVVVSTKITVPLISAGVGTLTKVANWKQSPWNNILLNPVGPLVDIFEKNTWDPWSTVFEEIANDIDTLRSEKNYLPREL